MENTDESVSAGTYVFLLFLTLINIMNFVDRQLLASFANWIVPELGLTDTEFGLLTGLVFLFFYSVAGVFMGMLADRYNRIRLISIGLALWSALTAASGAAKGFISLAIPRLFIGVGESMLTPNATSLLADKFPPSRRGFAIGVYYMGVPIGVATSLLVVAYLEPILGWRGCFYALGALGLALALVVLLIKEPKRTTDVAVEVEVEQPTFREMLSILWGAMSKSPALTLTILGGVSYHFMLGAATFEQLWFVEERGYDRTEIAMLTGWLGLAGGILGNLAGGIGGDAFLRKTGIGRPMFVFWVMLIMMPFMLVRLFVEPGTFFFEGCIFLGYFLLGCFYGPTFATVQDLVPTQIRATVIAFYILSVNLVGVAIGVSFAGIAIDIMRQSGVADPYTWALFGFTLFSTSAIPLFFFAGKRYARDKEALHQSLKEAEGS